jgi:hypothetical protein
MIQAVEIENFKGVAARQRIDFAPLTLLFGANSAGKSTILQSLAYLHEVIMRGDADVDRTALGGEVLGLGGFARLIHRHELGRTMVIRAEFLTPDSLNRVGRGLRDFPFPDLDDSIDSAWLEVEIQHRITHHHRGPVVGRAQIGVNGDAEPLLWLELAPGLRDGEPVYVRVNLGHALLAESAADVVVDWEDVAVPDQALRAVIVREGGRSGDDRTLPSLGATRFGDGRALPVFAVSRSRLSALPPLDEPMRVILPTEDEPTPEQAVALTQIRTFLEMAVLGTVAQLASTLERTLYLGPLRAVPPRGFLFQRAGRVSRWGDGLAAWDLLLADRTTLVECVNRWLKRLEAGCQIVVQHLVDAGASAEDLADGHVDASVRRLLLDTRGTLVLPSEVGAGIAQVVPVLVAAVVEGKVPLALIEQPEIHVHPRLQVGLGDLFIEAARNRHLVIETHSEHLILRLLRRIRETHEGELQEGAPSFTPDQLCVLYVEAGDAGLQVRRLRVDETGEFLDRWPRGFFEERAHEVF